MNKKMNPKLVQYVEIAQKDLCRKNIDNLNYFLGTQKLLRVRGRDWWMAQVKPALQAYREADELLREFMKTTSHLIVRCRLKSYKVSPVIQFGNVQVKNQYLFWVVEKRKGAGDRIVSTLNWKQILELSKKFNLNNDEQLAHIHANASLINVNAIMRAAVQDLKTISDVLSGFDEMDDELKRIPDYMFEHVE